MGVVFRFAEGLGKFWDKMSGSEREREDEQSFNSAEAAIQRGWEEEMSNSAYQRSVADMKKAGLNPAMMYTGSGSSASTPVGSSAKSSAGGSSGNFLSGVAAILSSAASLANNKNVDKHTTKQIYNSSGKLMKTVETLARNDK